MAICCFCKSYYPSLLELLAHFRGKHPKESLFECQEYKCPRYFDKKSAFAKHFRQKHEKVVKQQQNSSPTQNLLQGDKTADINLADGQPEAMDVSDDVTDHTSPIKLVPSENSKNSTDCFEDEISFKEEMLTETLNFVIKLYSQSSLPRNQIQKVIEFASDFANVFLKYLCKEVESNLLNNNVPSKSLSDVLGALSMYENLFRDFSTEYRRLKLFEEKKLLIKPVPYFLGESKDLMSSSKKVPPKSKSIMGQHIPLKSLFQRFFNMNDVTRTILTYQNDLLVDTSIYSNFIQGSYWRNEVLPAAQNRTLIPYFLYNDDFETGNPLSNHGGIHKLSGTYISFPTLPPEFRSKLENIFIVLLFHSADRKEFGNKSVFSVLISEINAISCEGILVNTEQFQGTVFPVLASIVGDNLGIHGICGFSESFSCNYPCIVCKMRKEEVKTAVVEDIALYRNPENYESDCKLENVTLTGIKQVCVWNEVKNFHVTKNISFDVMHDLLKGVCSYVLSAMLKHFIFTAKIFDLNYLNDRVENFDYGPIDSGNKPLAISSDELTKSAFQMSAAEMLIFVKYLGLIIGDKIPDKDKFWELYLSLRRIFDVVFAPFVQKGNVDKLADEVKTLNSLYISLCNDNLKVKFHNMTHYQSFFERFGPLVHMWAMRFEGKHRPSKVAATSIAGRVNITFSLTLKHQLQLMSLFNGNFKTTCVDVSPKAAWVILKDLEIASQLSLPEALRNEVLLSPWVKCHGTYYSPNSVILEKVEQDSPVFVYLHSICVTAMDEVYFICCDMRTIEFNHHIHAFKVEILETYSVVKQESLKFYSPVAVSTAADGDSYISLRHKW